RPHLVPVWFHWDGERIVAFSKPHARKVDNLREEPRVMLAVGTPGPEFEVELIEATAELPDQPAMVMIPEGFGAKYRELLRRAGLSVQRFAEVYSQPIVLRPTRFLGYGGRGWQEAGGFAT
ncbi:MAG: pyridoxamine 5'-phosphate oxidase family protein, partial [Chloroflexota bacterium]|nr:pyridoxamine 5'-phosphate oxidase family protein [Chloroflexota bacterium]